MTWPLVPLSEVCEPQTGTRDPRSEAGRPFTYVDIGSVDNKQKRIDGPKTLPGADAPSRARRVIKANDVIVSMTRPNLNAVAMVPDWLDGQICSTGFAVLRANGKVLPDYLFHFTTSAQFVRIASGAVSGAMYPAITERFLRSIEIPLPSLEEQRRIVDILNRANGIRRLRRDALDKARQLIPALFVDMFGDPTTNPMDWPVVSLGSLIAAGPQNGLYRPSSDYGSGTPIVRIDSFYDGQIVRMHELRRLRLDAKTIGIYGLREGDVLINRVNSRPFLGKSAIVPALTEPTVFESNMMRLTVDRSRVDPRYLIIVLQQRHVRNQLLARAKDAINQSSINQTDVRSVKVQLPPLALQSGFIERISEIQAAVAQQERMAEASDHLVASLMAQRFDGGPEAQERTPRHRDMPDYGQ